MACNVELECFVEEWSKSGEKEKILLKRNGEAAFVTKNREGIVIIVPLDDFRSIFFVPIPLLLLFICDEFFFLFFSSYHNDNERIDENRIDNSKRCKLDYAFHSAPTVSITIDKGRTTDSVDRLRAGWTPR